MTALYIVLPLALLIASGKGPELPMHVVQP